MESFEFFGQFHFIRPWWLLAILPAFVFTRYLLKKGSERSIWRHVISPHLLAHLLSAGGARNRVTPATVFMAVSILAAVAMSGPSWERSDSPFAEDLAPLAVVLDMSFSMDQTDVKPSRLERSKQKMRDLMSIRSASRTGIIVYAGTSHTVIPLTNDTRLIENLLWALGTDVMPRQGKSLERTLPRIREMFQETTIPGTILVMTDGVSKKATEAFARFCKTSGHQLIVYGIGKKEAPDIMMAPVGDHVLGGVFIPIEEKSLLNLAHSCKGMYQSSTIDKNDMERINRRIDFNFVSAADSSRPWIDGGYYLLFPLAALFVFSFRKGWTLTWGVALFLIFSAVHPPTARAGTSMLELWLTPDQQGRYYFEKGDFSKAAERFENTLWKGISYYMNENFEAAAEMFSRVETPVGYFNLGNALSHGQHYIKAVEAYERVLELVPGHAGAAKNKKLIQGIIDEINRVSESQMGEEGKGVKPRQDTPIRAQGAKKNIFGKKEVVQYNADQILNDPQLNDIWMRQVQQDPARFLSLKFQMQVENRNRREEGHHAP